MIIWIFLPLYFVHPIWGQGLKWEAHEIALSYMTATHAIEYIAVQIAYSNIGVKWSFSRFYHPLKSWIFGFLSQIDFYSDIAMTREIYKCAMVKEHSDRYLVIYLVSLITVIWYKSTFLIKLVVNKQSQFSKIKQFQNILKHMPKCLNKI